MLLNESQNITLQQINFFLNKPGSGVFILKGYAGTGKTTLLQHLAKKLQVEKLDFVLLAPTGRAASVLKAKTGLDAETIHSALYQFSDIDGDADPETDNPNDEDFGQMRLLFNLRAADPSERKIYIVDEASMISDVPGDTSSYAHFGSGHLLSDLLQCVGTNKIIFAGDPSQLPPYACQHSPALSVDWMQKQGKLVENTALSEILRHKKDSGILKLATKIRELTNANNYPNYIKMPARNIDSVHINNFNIIQQEYLKSFDSNDLTKSIAICHSNNMCNQINMILRDKLFANARNEVQVGDVLMVTQNNYLVPLTNGDFVKVVDIGSKVNHMGLHFIQITVKADASGIEHQILMNLDCLYSNRANLRNDQQRLLMIDFSKKMRSARIKPKTDQYRNALQKDPYLNSLRANYGYAVTCQKSQGGEWNNVFLFLQKGMYVMDSYTLSRWWYTGVTRAKENLHLVDGWWIV